MEDKIYHILNEETGQFLHGSTRTWTPDLTKALTYSGQEWIGVYPGERIVTHEEALVISVMRT